MKYTIGATRTVSMLFTLDADHIDLARIEAEAILECEAEQRVKTYEVVGSQFKLGEITKFEPLEGVKKAKH